MNVWIITILVIAALFAFDFFFHVRKAHIPTIKEAAVWSAVYVGIAILFGLFVWLNWGGQFGGEYFAGYVTEKALSVDNLFVFLIIMGSFAVPREDQQKALMWGIVLALAFRLVFILVGAAALNQWAWLFYLFAAFLAYTAIKQVVDHRQERRAKLEGTYEQPDMSNNRVVAIARKFLPLTDRYVEDKIVTRIDGKRVFTPMILVIIALGAIDLIFALDSIPAIFGLTQESYLVFTANAFSLMGLRQLYFLIDGLLERLIFLAYGLAAILGFIAVKLWLHAMHEADVPLIGGPWSVPEVGIGFSLTFILGVIAVVVVASLVYSNRHPEDPMVSGKMLGADDDSAEAPSEQN